jgi:hypothetical protein
MGQCHQTTLVTVTYPVINYILHIPAFIPTLNQRLMSLYPSTIQYVSYLIIIFMVTVTVMVPVTVVG